GLSIYLENSGKVVVSTGSGTGSTELGKTTSSFNNNQWNYFVFTRFSNGTSLFYINNNLVISSNSFYPTQRTATLRIGERENG
ncbi:LamG domain-containing protein, partial [Pseudomonas sp. Kh13]|uniref:LamG domain-containing protein n=1 Tax=Pseudomonas sp. Kh13 TaxID=2093744 RepID=UPI0011821254